MQRRNVTIFTDASFCHQTKAGGGAYWARDSEHRAQAAFCIKAATQAHEAELIASCRAIMECLKDPNLGPALRQPGTRLILVIDCLFVKSALEWREGRKPKMNEDLWIKVTRVRNIIYRAGFELKINHVKAHTGTKQPRTWVNDWCDSQAKIQMRRLRNSLKVPLLCGCGKGQASKEDEICSFCRERWVSRAEAKKVGVRHRGDGLSLEDYRKITQFR